MAEHEFFKAGHTYGTGQNGFTAPELTDIFHVEHITRHPDRRTLRAIGWCRTGEPGSKWHGFAQDEDQRDGWSELPMHHFAPPPTGLDADLEVYRAEYDGIPLESYTVPDAARTHCEAHARRDWPDSRLDWIEDDEDRVAELTVWVDGEEQPTGYTVTAVVIPSAYDPEADE